MGGLLQDKHLVPDFIISSTAKRARSTANEGLGFSFEFLDEIGQQHILLLITEEE